MSDTNKDESILAQPSAHVNVNRIEISERTLSIISIVASVAAIVTAFFAVHESTVTRGYAQQSHSETLREVDKLVRETKQLQIQVMDNDALLLRHGIKLASDVTYGPAGNLEYEPPKKGE